MLFFVVIYWVWFISQWYSQKCLNCKWFYWCCCNFVQLVVNQCCYYVVTGMDCCCFCYSWYLIGLQQMGQLVLEQFFQHDCCAIGHVLVIALCGFAYWWWLGLAKEQNVYMQQVCDEDLVEVEGIMDVQGRIQDLFLLSRFCNTWYDCKLKLVSCQVLGFIVCFCSWLYFC